MENIGRRINNNLLHVSCHEAVVPVQVCIPMNPLQMKLFFSVLQSKIIQKQNVKLQNKRSKLLIDKHRFYSIEMTFDYFEKMI